MNGEVQRPPRQAQQRHPEQLALEEEPQQGDAPVEGFLQHRDVHPALVVGEHQEVAAVAQPVHALDHEASAGERIHQRAVDADPALGDQHQRPVEPGPQPGQRQQGLEQRHQQQDRHVQQGAGADQQAGE